METPGIEADLCLVIDFSIKIVSLLSQYYTQLASRRLRRDIENFVEVLRETEHLLCGLTGVQLLSPEILRDVFKDCHVRLSTLEQTLSPRTIQLIINYVMLRGFQLPWPFKREQESRISQELEEYKERITLASQMDQTRYLTNGDEIRLIQLEPGHGSSPLRATISYSHLSENPSFEALSYTWGCPYTDTHPSWSVHLRQDPAAQPYLFTDAKIFKITDNLHAALSRLRQPTQAIVLWVDALCINQLHNEEKAWQIQKMQEIYSKASRVLIWLGPADATSDVAMAWLQRGYRYMLRTQPYRSSAYALTVDAPEPMAGQESADQMVAASFAKLFGLVRTDLGIPDYPIAAAANLLSRAYWGRGWCLQEFTVAKKVTILCGEKSLEDGDMCLDTFLQTWDRLSRESGIQPRTLDHRPWSMMNLRRSYLNLQYLEDTGFEDSPSIETPGRDIPFSTWAYMNPNMTQVGKAWAFRDALDRFSLKNLLQESTTSWLETGRKEDQIIALVGLASDAVDLGIKIDCTLPWETLYLQVAVAYLKRGDLWFLNYCQWTSSDRSPNLPSWVPDWSQEWHGSFISSHYLPPPEHLGTAEAESQPDIREVKSHQRLRLRGIVVDEIAWCSSERFQMSISALGTRLRLGLYQWIRNIVSQHSIRDLRALWTVLIAHADHPALPQKYHEKFTDEEMRRMLDDAFISILTESRAKDAELQSIIECYLACLMQVTSRRCVFGTKDGRLGLSRANIRNGDRIAVFMNTETAHVLRPVVVSSSDAPRYRIIAESYVYNLMEDTVLKANAVIEDIVLE